MLDQELTVPQVATKFLENPKLCKETLEKLIKHSVVHDEKGLKDFFLYICDQIECVDSQLNDVIMNDKYFSANSYTMLKLLGLRYRLGRSMKTILAVAKQMNYNREFKVEILVSENWNYV